MKFYIKICKLFGYTLFIFLTQSCQKTSPSLPKSSIVFIHLGPSLPPYLSTAITQARLFNPTLPIYLLANERTLRHTPKEFASAQVQLIPCESLLRSDAHKQFLTQCTFNKKFREGFWIFTKERFFYLASFMKEYKLSSVFHFESDVMLYTDLNELLPIFQKNYAHKIGATIDNDHRCIPGLFYVADSRVAELFTKFMAQKKYQSANDMQVLAAFYKEYRGQWMDSLPILMPEYAQEHELISQKGSPGMNKEDFYRHFEEFNSIFDAAALGQYLGGIDPRNGDSIPGFINEECVFNAENFQFEWIEDHLARKVPWILYQDKAYKINNLHIHSKNLKAFAS